MNDPGNLDLLRADPQPTPAPRGLVPRELVFIGMRVDWRRKIADEEIRQQLASRWEDGFSHWSFNGRSLHLCIPSLGYSVDLTDGQVKFTGERPGAAFVEMRAQVNEVVDILRAAGREDIGIHCEAQFLEPVSDLSFASLVAQIARKLQGSSALASMNASLLDFAFMSDVAIDGVAYRLNAGAVRAHEISSRVASTKLKYIPKLARFYSIESQWLDELAPFRFDVFTNRIFTVGAMLAKEMRE